MKAPCPCLLSGEDIGPLLPPGTPAPAFKYALVANLEHVGPSSVDGHWLARTRRLASEGPAAPDTPASAPSRPATDVAPLIVPSRQWMLFNDGNTPVKVSWSDVALSEASVLLYERVNLFCWGGR